MKYVPEDLKKENWRVRVEGLHSNYMCDVQGKPLRFKSKGAALEYCRSLNPYGAAAASLLKSQPVLNYDGVQIQMPPFQVKSNGNFWHGKIVQIGDIAKISKLAILEVYDS